MSMYFTRCSPAVTCASPACRLARSARVVGGGRLGARVSGDPRRALLWVHEQAVVAPAVVAGDAGAEIAVGQPDGVGRVEISNQLFVAAAEHVVPDGARVLFGLLGLGNHHR